MGTRRTAVLSGDFFRATIEYPLSITAQINSGDADHVLHRSKVQFGLPGTI
jgi:hypothetical protein